MSTHSHALPKAPGTRFTRADALNVKHPNVPNRTKVVRMIVCPGGFKPDSREQVTQLANARHAARVDAFIVFHKDKWQPMYWDGGALEPHHDALINNPESVCLLFVEAREQLQWECDVPFRIIEITPVSKPETGFVSNGTLKQHPFRQDLINEEGGPGRPLISGPPALEPKGYDQLLKLTFELMLDGKWVVIDPDVHCDWN
jgi:hypothetical protein